MQKTTKSFLLTNLRKKRKKEGKRPWYVYEKSAANVLVFYILINFVAFFVEDFFIQLDMECQRI